MIQWTARTLKQNSPQRFSLNCVPRHLLYHNTRPSTTPRKYSSRAKEHLSLRAAELAPTVISFIQQLRIRTQELDENSNLALIDRYSHWVAQWAEHLASEINETIAVWSERDGMGAKEARRILRARLQHLTQDSTRKVVVRPVALYSRVLASPRLTISGMSAEDALEDAIQHLIALLSNLPPPGRQAVEKAIAALRKAGIHLDTHPPVIAITAPSDGSTFQDVSVVSVSVTVSDSLSGPDPSQVVVTIDGIDVSTQLVVSGSDASITGSLFMTGTLPVSVGSLTIAVTASDLAGNIATQAATFSVETQEVTISLPEPGKRTIVVRNADDDNFNGKPDLEEINVVQNPSKTGSQDDNNLGHLTIKITGSKNGDATLTITKGANKIKVWKTPTKTKESDRITFNGTDNKFTVTNDPQELTLYVEGIEASDKMNDIEIQCSHKGKNPTTTYTVLWVDVTARTGDTEDISPDNGAREYHKLTNSDDNHKLGTHLFDDRMGIAIEIIGTVHPSDFPHKVILWRDAEAAHFIEEPSKPREEILNVKTFTDPEPIHYPPAKSAQANDTSGENSRDDDPQSGGSGGKVYDLDAPGETVCLRHPPGTVRRGRSNFKEFAHYQTECTGMGIPERCSEFLLWSCARSFKLTGSQTFGTFESGTNATASDSDVDPSQEGNQSPNWVADQWAKSSVCIIGGTGSGKEHANERIINSNTADTITVRRNCIARSSWKSLSMGVLA